MVNKKIFFIGILLLMNPTTALGEWQIKPFIGLSFGGDTTFIDVENAAQTPNITFGASGLLLGEIFGVEADIGHAPGFFQSDDRQLVQRSSVTTASGSVVVALPRRLSEYGLRPYFVSGAGVMHVRIDHHLGVLKVSSTLPAIHIGGGATGFFNSRLGLSWDVRHYYSIGEPTQGKGLSFGGEKLSFWRATMALALRY